MARSIIEFTLRADFGFFRKPDTNDGIVFGYGMLHRPALLGILGAILGLDGFRKKGQRPEYLDKLGSLPIGIAPASAPHPVTQAPADPNPAAWATATVEYNNGVGYASQEQGGNWILREQMTVGPAFTCYVLIDDEDGLQAELGERLMTGRAEFLPYFGKNEFAAGWLAEETVRHEFTQTNDFSQPYKIDSLVREPTGGYPPIAPGRRFSGLGKQFYYIEDLPTEYREDLWQYRLAQHVYTTFRWQIDRPISNLFQLADQRIVQLN